MAENKAGAPAHLKDLAGAVTAMMAALSKDPELARKQLATVVRYAGTEITLPAEPEPMSHKKAIEVLLAQEAAATQRYDLFERVPGMPFDAAAAFCAVLKERYGWVHAVSKQTWFGEKPPRMQVVKIGPNPEDFIEVPVGQFKLDDISTELTTGFADPEDPHKSQFMDFYIAGTVSFEDRKVIMDLIAKTREHMAKHSIYRGKALHLRTDNKGNLEKLIQPEFINVSGINTDALILKDDIAGLLDMTLFTPIKKTQACRKHKIPLKRGILLHGPYGTGKSLCGAITARHANDNGWTYVIVDDATALAKTLEFARQFQPCVVFAEDIDRVVGLDRSDDANDIVNTIDSVLNKSDEIIVVLTTNHIDKLPPVILRPGRLDALVPVDLPDAKAAIRLVGLYSGDLLIGNEPLTAVGEALAGFMPSTIREVVERAKLSMLLHDRSGINASDLVAAATGIRAHAELLKERQPVLSAEHQLGAAVKRVMLSEANGVGVLDGINETIEALNKRTKAIAGAVGAPSA